MRRTGSREGVDAERVRERAIGRAEERDSGVTKGQCELEVGALIRV